ncbi:UDP-glycosyltransferase 88F5 [Senna tora]|uniref:isoflavone 7-O-glucosyltransferase n=1 Tax=Senna tora TaxID=362788 RepID=A0A835CC92_9FABA|nr:UDP-glycosyltransferase 88F5 [Senna tora]
MQKAIVLYAAPGIGHIISMVELGKLILHHHPNSFSITILLTTGFLDKPSVDSYLHRISQSYPSISFLRFPMVTLDPSSTRSFVASCFDFVRLNTSHVASALTKISQTSNLRAFIIDVFCTPAASIASSLGIPLYYFYTCNAACLSASIYFPKIHQQTHKSLKDLSLLLQIPGNPPIKAFHMAESVLDRDDPGYADVLHLCSYLPKSDGIIVNTFEDLEPIAIKAITEGACFPDPKQAPPVFYIGPLIMEPDRSSSEEEEEKAAEARKCLSWLDKQPSRSVVFLCFGSRGSFSALQLKEIADGLEKSGQRFLWVVKRPPTDENSKQTLDTTNEGFDLGSVLPSGFMERTEERGMVVKSWAPQVEVLNKEAVGGFVTHCGWNSVLEAVVAGVPMVAWPLYAEQHMNRNKAIVLYAAPGIGHIIAMVELGKLILHHHPNSFSITILLTTGFLDKPSIDSYLHRISQSYPSISFLRFPLLDPSSTPKYFDFIRLHTPHVASALTQISQTSHLRAFIIDAFCTPAATVASSLGIPLYYFFTCNAACLSTSIYFPKIHQQTHKSLKDLSLLLHIPGNPPTKAFHMPESMLDRDRPDFEDVLYLCSYLPKSDGIIVNTFEDLEPIAIKAITEGACFPDPKLAPPVFYIGPLIMEPDQSGSEEEEEKAAEARKCLSWLDKQPSRSVVFLCFGSRGSFSALQLKEIADGLEKSGQRFLWVVKRPPTDENSKQTLDTTNEGFDLGSLLPSGFMERTEERGMLVKSWAPQVEVLNKEAVGGFVTHCGWNSVLEAVVAGVPMVAWPLYAEQHMNRNVLMEDMKMAIGLEQRDGDGFVSGDELEKRVREVMESEKGKAMRERSWKMREMAKYARSASGSSTRALKNVVETWNNSD